MSTLDPRIEEERRSAWPVDLIETVYEAAAEPSHWPRWFDALSASLGHRASNLVIRGFGPTRYVSLDTPGSSFETLNPAKAFSRKALSRHCFALGYAGGDIVEDWTPFSPDVASPADIQVFTDDQRSLEVSDVDLLGDVLPHMHRALGLHFRVERLQHERESFGACFDDLATGIVLVDARLNVLHANKSARDYFNESSELRSDGGRLRASDDAADAHLGQNVKAAMNDPERSLRAQRLSHDVTAWIHAIDRKRAAVYITNEEGERSLAPELLEDAFGFSPAESEVASLLASGASVAEVAARLGKGVGTVRSQVKALQAKTATSRQSALVRHLLESIPPIRL